MVFLNCLVQNQDQTFFTYAIHFNFYISRSRGVIMNLDKVFITVMLHHLRSTAPVGWGASAGWLWPGGELQVLVWLLGQQRFGIEHEKWIWRSRRLHWRGDSRLRKGLSVSMGVACLRVLTVCRGWAEVTWVAFFLELLSILWRLLFRRYTANRLVFNHVIFYIE